MKKQKLSTRGTFTHVWSRRGQTRREMGEKLASIQIIKCVLTYTWLRSGSKIRSARIGCNTQFSASASKSHTPILLLPSQTWQIHSRHSTIHPCICEHAHGSRVGISKSALLHPATASHRCECTLTLSSEIGLGHVQAQRSPSLGHKYSRTPL